MIAFTVLLGVIYPLFIYGIGHVFFHHKTHGSIVYDQDGVPIGSFLIGQNFSHPGYFHPRPSAAGKQGYDASRSSGRNLGPTSQKLFDTLKASADTVRKDNSLSKNAKLPGDAVCASGSGLDPHISVENAELQVSRIASLRRASPGIIRDVIEKHTEYRFLGLFGEKRINVLKINLALDNIDL